MVALLAVLGGLYIGGTAITECIEQQLQQNPAHRDISILLAFTLLYALLLAIPFVPGVELGWAILMLLGVKGLILVYPATVLGLCLSFLLGRWIPMHALERLLHWLHLYRAEQLLRSARPLDSQNHLALLVARVPKTLGPILLRHRHLALAVAFNLPGNSVIGGGGGIAMLAGLSRLFSFKGFFVLVCLAITPIPITLLMITWTQ